MKNIFALLIVILCPFFGYGQAADNKISLHEAVEIGLRNNPEIKAAAKNIEAIKGKYYKDFSLPQPEINVNYNYIPLHSGISGFNERVIELRQSFEFPSVYFFRSARSNKEEEIALQKLQAVKRYVETSVKTAYYKVLSKKAQLNFFRENVEIAEIFLKKMEIRQKAGEGTNLEKLTAEIQFMEAGNKLATANNDLSNSYSELCYTLGLIKYNRNTEYELTDSLIFNDYNITIEQLIKLAEDHNPQILSGRLALELSAFDKKLAWSSLMPNFNLAYSKQSRDGSNDYYGASFGISVPLWFMFEQKGKISEADANFSITESDLQTARNQISLSLNNAYTDYDNNLKSVKLYFANLLPRAEAIYQTAVKSYDAGESTYLDYLVAKQTLIDSRNNYITSLFNYYQSVFRLEEITDSNILTNK